MRVVKKYITMEVEFENECNESSLKYTSLTTRQIFILTIRGLCVVLILDVQEFEWICPLLHHHFFKTIIRAWVLIYQCFHYKTHKTPCVRFNLLGHLCHSPELLKMVFVRRCVSCVKNWDTLASFFFFFSFSKTSFSWPFILYKFSMLGYKTLNFITLSS